MDVWKHQISFRKGCKSSFHTGISKRAIKINIIFQFLLSSSCGQFIEVISASLAWSFWQLWHWNKLFLLWMSWEEKSRNPKFIECPPAVMSPVRIMRQRDHTFLLCPQWTQSGHESFKVTLSSHNEKNHLDFLIWHISCWSLQQQDKTQGGSSEK